MAVRNTYIDVRIRANPKGIALVFLCSAVSGALFGLAMSLSV